MRESVERKVWRKTSRPQGEEGRHGEGGKPTLGGEGHSSRRRSRENALVFMTVSDVGL
jgi:hypothetical protein